MLWLFNEFTGNKKGKEVQLVGLYHTFTGYRLDLLGLEWMRWSLNEVRQDFGAMILVESGINQASFHRAEPIWQFDGSSWQLLIGLIASDGY